MKKRNRYYYFCLFLFFFCFLIYFTFIIAVRIYVSNNNRGGSLCGLATSTFYRLSYRDIDLSLFDPFCWGVRRFYRYSSIHTFFRILSFYRHTVFIWFISPFTWRDYLLAGNYSSRKDIKYARRCLSYSRNNNRQFYSFFILFTTIFLSFINTHYLVACNYWVAFYLLNALRLFLFLLFLFIFNFSFCPVSQALSRLIFTWRNIDFSHDIR